MKPRKLTLEQAKARFPHRFTMEHCPNWALSPFGEEFASPSLAKRFPAPQYASDLEWYQRTIFPGEPGLHGNNKHCESRFQTWPLGQSLDKPFNVKLSQELATHFQQQLQSAR